MGNQEETKDNVTNTTVEVPNNNSSPVDLPKLENQSQENNAPVDNIVASIASSEATTAPAPKTDSTVIPADFSQIFNVASEETPEAKPAAPVKIDNPKKDEPITIGEPSDNPDRPKKNIEESYNGKERILYEIKPEKEGSPLVVVVFFAILIGMIFALPYISKKFSFNNGPNNQGENNGADDQNDEFYQFYKSSVRAKLGDLEFTNFVKTAKGKEFTISFNITNTAEKAYQFNEKYYVVLYDKEMILGYVLIHSYDIIGANQITGITLNITERAYNANRFKIQKISTEQYPEKRLSIKDGDYDVMTCSRLNDEIKYYFLEGKLDKLIENYTEEAGSSPSYSQHMLEYEALSDKLKKVDNLTSNFIKTDSYFTMLNEFKHKDISDSTLSGLKQYKFFRYNETKNVVSFEMEAQGYTCG